MFLSSNLVIAGFSEFEMWDRDNTRLSITCKTEKILNCGLNTCKQNDQLIYYQGSGSKTVEMDFFIINYKTSPIIVTYYLEYFLDKARNFPCPK